LPDPVVRPASVSDAADIASIYAHYVAHSTATFETDAPAAGVWSAKVAAMAERGWPFLVCEAGGEVCGYSYATQFRDRPAYARTCESSVYVREGLHGRGIGKLLMFGLIDASREAGFEQMIAVIASEGPASVALHARLGFEHAGRMRNVGFKFGKRLDTIYMQRDLTRESSA